jgi:hypothetical protein
MPTVTLQVTDEAAEHNDTVEVGETWIFPLTLSNDDETPMDLTGMTFESQWRVRAASSADLITTPTYTVEDNTVILRVEREDTYALETSGITQFFYDVFLIDSLGVATPLIYGRMTVRNAATYPVV